MPSRRDAFFSDSGRPAGTMNQDLISDPTLPRTREITCDACSHNEAVFFHSSVSCATVS